MAVSSLVLITGCGAQSPAVAPTSVAPIPAARLSTVLPAAPAANPSLGTAYSFTLFRHCGIGTVPFGGRMWMSGDAVPPPEPDASGMATENGSTDGTMRLIAADRLEFTYRAQPTSPPRTLVFTPTTATQQPCV